MTQILAAAILAGGAFYGVYKGAVYAVDRLVFQLREERVLSEERLDAEANRLQMQLDAESERLARQLDAESERLDRQLAADRDKQDRAELRDILDDGAILLAQALGQLQAAQLEVEAPVNANPAIAAHELRNRPQNVAGFIQLGDEIDRYWQRLMLRFRVSDEIPTAVSSAKGSFKGAMEVFAIKREDIGDEQLQQFGDRRKSFTGSHASFLEECRKRFGVKDAT